MAETILNISGDQFDDATLRISLAEVIVTALSIHISESDLPGRGKVSGSVLHDALMGASILLKDAHNTLSL